MPNWDPFWRVVTSRIFIGIALLASCAIAVGIARSVQRRSDIAEQVSALRRDIGTYESKRQELDRILRYVGTAEYREREARLRLGLKKPGEEVVVIPGLKGKTRGGETPAETPSEIPNWQRWLRYFFKS